MKSPRPSWIGPSRVGAVVLLSALIAGCNSLPHDGPSSQSVPHDAAQPGAHYALVDLTLAEAETIAAMPPAALTGLANDSSLARNDLIAVGDQVSVSIFEPGSTGLFTSSVSQAAQGGSTASAMPKQSSLSAASMGGGSASGAMSAHTLPSLVVALDGTLQIPFAGDVHVEGLSPEQASKAIQRALHGRAIDPQVTVAVVASHANSVSVFGEVRLPGRLQLAAHNDRLLDLLAQAGGPLKPIPDLALGIYRGDKYAEAPLSLLMSDPAQNIRMAPEDRVLVLDRPRKYSTFGSVLKNDNQSMGDDPITLADAIAKGGALNTYTANAASVLIFRFERPEVARALGVTLQPAAKGVPIVYRLNFRHPESLFIANNLLIQPEDLLYIPVSDLTEAQKFFEVVDSVTQIGYNARITTSRNVP